MFTRIQTRAFRCLRNVDQRLGAFRVLVGPNASGKTTFLDVIGFLSDLMRNRGDLLGTIHSRSTNFQKLLWLEEGEAFQLAIEAEIPSDVRDRLAPDKSQYTHVRYEIEVGLDESRNEIGINHETLWLLDSQHGNISSSVQRDLFPTLHEQMPDLILAKGKGRNVALKKSPGGNDNYYTE
ncbi:MAG: AAA family ATPase, partial [Planctomycetales bacterium]|nr:AAA family ATPase [Planctomycetales bacterium]